MAKNNEEYDKICGTQASINDIVHDICTKVGVKGSLKSWSAVEIGDGKGFMSVMAKISLHWSEPHEKLPKSVVAKIPTSAKITKLMGEQQGGDKELFDSFMKEAYKVHNCEVSSYEVLVNCPITLAYIYGTRRLLDNEAMSRGDASAYILMEDLSDQCGHYDLLMGEAYFTNEQTEQLLTTLATLHAWGYLHPEEVAKIDVIDVGAFFDKASGDKYNEAKEKEWQEFLKRIKEPELIDVLGDRPGEIKRMKPKGEWISAENRNKYKKYNIPTSLCMGDLHANNIMFNKDDQGKPTGDLHALIDWQVTNLGNPLSDVIRAMSQLCGLQDRSLENCERLLKFYFDEYIKHLSAGGKACPYTFDELKTCFHENYVASGKMTIASFVQWIDKIKEGSMPIADPEKGIEAIKTTFKQTYLATLDAMDKLGI